MLIEHRYARSGLAAVKDRVAALSPADLQSQLVRIGRALVGDDPQPLFDRARARRAHRARRHLARFPRRLRLWIARELVDRGVQTPHGIGYAGWALMDETGPRRHHLYDGSLGPAVFLAAAAVVSGEDRWRRCARDFAGGASAAVARGLVDDAAIGVGLSALDGLRPDHHRRAARRFDVDRPGPDGARSIAPHRIARDTALDSISGAAGAALGLLPSTR